MPEDVQASQELLVSGFLGAIALAALVFLLQYSEPFRKPEWFLSADDFFSILVLLLSLVIVFSVYSSLMTIDIAGGVISSESLYGWFAIFGLAGAWFFLMLFLPLLLLTVNAGVAGLIAVVEFIWFLVFYFAPHRKRG